MQKCADEKNTSYQAKQTSSSIKDYITQIKMEKLTDLFLNLNFSISEVSHYIGFSDVLDFN